MNLTSDTIEIPCYAFPALRDPWWCRSSSPINNSSYVDRRHNPHNTEQLSITDTDLDQLGPSARSISLVAKVRLEVKSTNSHAQGPDAVPTTHQIPASSRKALLIADMFWRSSQWPSPTSSACSHASDTAKIIGLPSIHTHSISAGGHSQFACTHTYSMPRNPKISREFSGRRCDSCRRICPAPARVL